MAKKSGQKSTTRKRKSADDKTAKKNAQKTLADVAVDIGIAVLLQYLPPLLEAIKSTVDSILQFAKAPESKANDRDGIMAAHKRFLVLQVVYKTLTTENSITQNLAKFEMIGDRETLKYWKKLLKLDDWASDQDIFERLTAFLGEQSIVREAPAPRVRRRGAVSI